jgi:glycerol-3-phosphate cytidylyltransferase-like family protein
MNVYASMVGDLFNASNLEFCKKCKKLGDNLILGIHKEYYDKKNIPILSLQERVDLIKGIKDINKIIKEAPHIITTNFIKKHNINIIAIPQEIPYYIFKEKYKNIINIKNIIIKRIITTYPLSWKTIKKRIMKTPYHQPKKIIKKDIINWRKIETDFDSN